MALSDDQKAILRLLAQRGAGLRRPRGPDGDQRRRGPRAGARRRWPSSKPSGIPAPAIPAPPASAATASADPDTEPEPEPARPPPRAAAPSRRSPSRPPASRHPKTAAGRLRRPRPKLSLPSSGGGRAALAAGVAIVVALVIVILVSGGDDSGDTTTAARRHHRPARKPTDRAATNPKLTQAVLDPVDGSDAKGVATFGRVKNSLALQVEAEGLEPTGDGESYTIWLYASPQKMLPLASTAVAENGRIGAQVEVPTEVLAYLANETFDQLDISQTTDATLKASLAKATQGKEGAGLHRHRRPPRHRSPARSSAPPRSSRTK